MAKCAACMTCPPPKEPGDDNVFCCDIVGHVRCQKFAKSCVLGGRNRTCQGHWAYDHGEEDVNRGKEREKKNRKQSNRTLCVVKECTKQSRGRETNNMCTKHFKKWEKAQSGPEEEPVAQTQAFAPAPQANLPPPLPSAPVAALGKGPGVAEPLSKRQRYEDDKTADAKEKEEEKGGATETSADAVAQCTTEDVTMTAAEKNNTADSHKEEMFEVSGSGTATTTTTRSPVRSCTNTANLILTATTVKRSLYECDYCKTDITHSPRIRCAVCSDFDACLKCFVTTDQEVAKSKKAALEVAAALVAGDEDVKMLASAGGSGTTNSATKDSDPCAAASASSGTVASVAAVDVTGDHEPTHGYRVSDSTRFLVFPTARDVRKSIAPNKDEAAAVAPTAAGATAPTRTRTAIVTDKPKAVWTAEEDLRLLDAISTYGLGNWDDISEAVAGTGSTSPYSSNKSARQCMERYFDDFMGRFGHILPPYTLVEDGGDGTASSSAANEDIARSNCDGLVTDKKYRAVPTSSLPGYESVWPHPHLPDIPNVKFGDEVGRDLAVRAEQEFVKATTSVQNKDDADKIREEWLKNRLRKPGGPTVLPMRMEDIHTLSGSELAGYMPRRGDFDIEWDNDAEALLANMEFSANDAPNDRQLKLQIIEIYNAKLDERERRKQFLIDRGLLDYRKNQAEDLLLPPDERDLVNRMRLFARFHSPEEHEKFVKDLLKAKRLRKEIAKLQQYRRMGLQTLREAEMYELDRERRDHHKLAHVQKEVADEKAAKAAAASTAAAASSTDHADHADAPSLGKKYGSSDCQAKMFGDRGGGATSMEIDDDGDKEPVDKFRIYDKPGYDLLSSKEIKLCEKLELLPALYIEAKKALIAESFKAGIIASGSSKASIAKIDVEKRDGVVDFVLRSGWIQRKPNLQNAAVKK